MIKTKPKVYIVEDDESVHRALSRLLKFAGYEAEAFNSAQSFLDSVPADTKAVLVLDIRIPDIDGFELQKRLNSLRSKVQIIFITAHSQAGDRERAMEAGAKGFLLKPFSDELLLDLINSITFERG